MGGGIYLIQDEDHLVEMMEQSYDSEERLQELIEKYPNLLAGDQIDRATPRWWLGITREITSTLDEEDDNSWSLDHLFVDQDGIPTLVAIQKEDSKRSRREMMGKMLEYAAQLPLHWPVESVIAQFELNCREQGRDPEQVFESFLGTDVDEEKFWQKVKTHLQAGKVRLIFVSDEVSPEFRVMIEFLNPQMDPLEILALEVKQYVSETGLKTLVPRVIGKTAESQQKKASTVLERRRWDQTSFFYEYGARQSQEEAQIVRRLYDWVIQDKPLRIKWGMGDTYGGFSVWVAPSNAPNAQMSEFFSISIDGVLQVSSRSYAILPPFDKKKEWNYLRNQFSSIGLSLPVDPVEPRLTSFVLSSLQDESALNRVIDVLEAVLSKVMGNRE
ncbi:MAG: hypothetical protein J7545_11880 [Roseofilum sp. SBFL]|uniref:hypothetical protein n=1 Tax=unclassified Roseofilum TaxID=2620099 RepID=UPI001B18FC89|nr:MULTISPECIES: hypothetical protein [unclassified Roseofilum]MBP0015601.1 hypothetical protein [Roseofilum sp. SID3]MBP0022698.1 hypothetical protein [Roseofilum sp. SID2]MBP0039258.1 hypothetical protein [Roseofilum sp. SID1]MBP0042660.1 hypothetical protein [Roseofilum sp. SBFL]